jgi:hypothetical protein
LTSTPGRCVDRDVGQVEVSFAADLRISDS